jgi:hypothetical protein
MRVKILRDLVTRGGRTFREGREHDMSDGEANVLIRRGIAVAMREMQIPTEPPVRRVTKAAQVRKAKRVKANIADGSD